MKLKKFKDFTRKIERNPKVNSGKAFYVEGQDITKLASNLIEFLKDNGIDLGENLPAIEFNGKNEGNKKIPSIFKETGRYDLFTNRISIFTDKRALKDCLRSLAHELTHADQNLIKGMDTEAASLGITNGNREGEKIEADAYKRGNILFRKWEETLRSSF